MNKIYGWRKMVGLSQKDMAIILGVSEGTYRNKEKGYTAFKEKELLKIFKVFKNKGVLLSIEDFFLR